jgi:threonine synthase
MAEAGAFADGRRVVLLITGHGLKTVEALSGRSPFAAVIEPRYDDFAAFWEGAAAIPAAS